MFKAVSGLVFGLMVLAASSAKANEQILLDEANPPFMYSNGGGAAGIYNALIAEAFKRAGIASDISTGPWKRALSGLEAGQNGVGGIYQNAERLRKYDYSEKLFDEVIIVYVPTGRQFTLSGVDSLKGKTVGVIRGWSYGDDFDQAVKAGTIKTEETSSDAQNFAKLSLGRIDAILAIKESAAVAISSQDLAGKVQALEPPLSSSPSFLAFNKSAAKDDVLGKFNAALAAMHQDGSFDKIVSSILSK